MCEFSLSLYVCVCVFVCVVCVCVCVCVCACVDACQSVILFGSATVYHSTLSVAVPTAPSRSPVEGRPLHGGRTPQDKPGTRPRASGTEPGSITLMPPKRKKDVAIRTEDGEMKGLMPFFFSRYVF